MANVFLQGPKGIIKDAGLNNTYIIGTGDETEASWITIDIRSVAATGNLTLVARGSPKACNDDAVPFIPIMYRPMNLNGVAVAGSTLVATAITTDSIITIPSSGQTVALLAGGVTTGSFNVYIQMTHGQGF